MRFIAGLCTSDPRVLGKARSLARLQEAGLATPSGFVVTDALFRALCPRSDWPQILDEAALAKLASIAFDLQRAPWPSGLQEELAHALSALPGDRFAVRSSFAGEDEPGRLAAGVFDSVVNVPPDAVHAALRKVLLSGIAPGAVAYALARGLPPAAGPRCVLIHTFVGGQAEGSAACTPEGPPVVQIRRGVLNEENHHTLAEALRTHTQKHGPTEIEWVLENGVFCFLQARPYEAPRPQVVFAGLKELGPSDPPPGMWRWDAAHNPLPLSPAQQGLVALADEACRIGIRQRALGGYLFYAPDDRPIPQRLPPEDAGIAFSALSKDFTEKRAGLGSVPDLEQAIALFLGIYQPLFGVIQPAIRRMRKALAEFLALHAPSSLVRLGDLLRDVPSAASERRVLAAKLALASTREAQAAALLAYCERFGDEAPSWDVAEPTYAEAGLVPEVASESPRDVDWTGVAQEVAAAIPRALEHEFHRLLASAREAVALSEADDALYAKAQACVRHALLAVGKRAAGALVSADDIFFLPLGEVRAFAITGKRQLDWAAAIRRQRKAWEEARANPPDFQPGLENSAWVRGQGVGGRAVGRVAKHVPGRGGPRDPRSILMARTLLPTELPLIAAAALVVETGGILDHVAAQARERNLPAVVGAAHAVSQFRDGDWVLVDGDRGLVIRL